MRGSAPRVLWSHDVAEVAEDVNDAECGNRIQEANRSYETHTFDWVIALLSLWLVGCVHLDAWAHHQFAVETFFTPWHGVLYAGFLPSLETHFFQVLTLRQSAT